MAVKRSALGNNPLAQGIFSKTESEEESVIKIQDSRLSNQESLFLKEVEKEKINLRLSLELNDWLDNLLKQGKRKHGQKIAKEIWVQAALELFRAMPINWEEIETEEDLRSTLLKLESRIKFQDN
ncbi:MAG: hypothetical protein LH649_14150 [Pseudanabaena sp. CAN_BIN31]|jgi:choline kinase|nr:hypothetical protein [Pseudanabaena sp. CAN_BIN31]